MPSVHGPLRKFNVPDGRDESVAITETRLAVLAVTVQRVTEDGVVSGDLLQREALIDTGATTSAVDPALRAALDLEQSDYSERGSGGAPGEEERQLRPLYWRGRQGHARLTSAVGRITSVTITSPSLNTSLASSQYGSVIPGITRGDDMRFGALFVLVLMLACGAPELVQSI